MKITHKNAVLPVLTGLICAATLVAAGVTVNGNHAQLLDQKAEITHLTSRIEAVTLESSGAHSAERR